jgi:ATP-binding cassette subfamily B protein
MKTQRLLWRLVRYQSRQLLLLVSFWIISFTLPLATGWIVREFFNTLSGNAQVSLGIWELIALLIIVAIGRELQRVLTFAREPYIVESARALINKNLMTHLRSCPGAEAKPYSSSEMVSRFQGDTRVIGIFLIWAPTFIGLAIFTILAIVIMACINPLMTLGVIIPLVIVGGILRVTRSRIEDRRRATREAAGAISEIIGEIFGTAQAIKIANAEKSVIGHFQALNDKRRLASLKERRFGEFQNSLIATMISLSTGVILLLASQLIRTGDFTIGDLTLFTYYLEWIKPIVFKFGDLLIRVRQVGVSFERLVELLEGEAPAALVQRTPIYLRTRLPDVPYVPKSDAHRLVKLEVSDLTYRFPDTGLGIEGIDLCLERGTFTVITGQVGSGKTTLLRVLLGLLPRDRGEIRWNGMLVKNPTTFFGPPRSAYTSQVPRLFSDTLRDNILMGLPEEKVDLPSAIDSAVLEQDLKHLENGLGTIVGPRGARLSGGQVQRAAAARMFVRNAELLVFDDLSSTLDVDTERLFWDRLFEQSGRTCLVVSHRAAALQRADQIIVLKEGRVQAWGELEQLLTTCEYVKHLWI